MDSFRSLLSACVDEHGHLCPGQVIGVRMAILGCRLIGLEEPRHREQIKKLLVYVEMDRCTADAVAHVTGARLGRRSLKFVDYGISAATFINLDTRASYRVLSTEQAREMAQTYAPECESATERQTAAYRRMHDRVLFRVQRVEVKFTEFDLPGPTRRKVACSRCGQMVRDARERMVDGLPVCRPCMEEAYFTYVREVAWSEMGWLPDESEREPAPEKKTGV
jgi:formylmethanofuran dehydrogenase subunit E